jgi:hypothetical protein
MGEEVVGFEEFSIVHDVTALSMPIAPGLPLT